MMEMKNIFFADETVTDDDLFFICYMIERVARKVHQKNRYVVNEVGKEEWMWLISLANVLHCENPLKIEDEWIEDYHLEDGKFDITNLNPDLADYVPTPLQMGKVYTRLILDTAQPGENYVDGLLRVYNDPICEVIDNYNSSAFYEPSYFIARAYNNGGF